MKKPAPFAALHTRAGRNCLLYTDSANWNICDIARYLGLDYNQGRVGNHQHQPTRAFVDELRKSACDFLDAGMMTGKPGDPGFTASNCAAEVSFIGIADAITQEYGPSLWGRDRREHLFRPKDIAGFKGLYWDKKEDFRL